MSENTGPDLVVDGILHPGERDRFVLMCQATPLSEVPALRQRIVQHLGRVEALIDDHPTLDADAARTLTGCLLSALDDMPTLDENERSLMRGAAEYFIDTNDERDDIGDPIGFDDDIRVANAVFETIERPDLIISF